MNKLQGISPERVFHYFEQICAIPHGSKNTDKISQFCLDFAAEHNLSAERDGANNVIIRKNASIGYENSPSVILQGHLDMVCQKTADSNINFDTDAINAYIDGDFVTAENTTLGADNGIAVAMILAILENNDISHPPLEAVFTADEEIGMLGAAALDCSKLKGRRMINLDAEEDWAVTVSCAGGSDFVMTIPTNRKKSSGRKAELIIKGLKGGHSGMEINSGRVNADILAGRVLNYLNKYCEFGIISVNGGDKGNAIANTCTIELLSNDTDALVQTAEEYFKIIKNEISERESNFSPEIIVSDFNNFDIIDTDSARKLEQILVCVPNGVTEMSAEISGLVETSLNLGILKTDENEITLHFTLRSNKLSAMEYLEERLFTLAKAVGCDTKTFGHYPPWEFNENSVMQKLYKEVFTEQFGHEPETAAIHAGLECGTFSAKMNNLDCIAIGPTMFDVHTVNEKLSISSTKAIYELLLKLLERCK